MTHKKKHTDVSDEAALVKCVDKCTDSGKIAWAVTSPIAGSLPNETFMADHGPIHLVLHRDSSYNTFHLKVSDGDGDLLCCCNKDESGAPVETLWRKVRHSLLNLEERYARAMEELKHEEEMAAAE